MSALAFVTTTSADAAFINTFTSPFPLHMKSFVAYSFLPHIATGVILSSFL